MTTRFNVAFIPIQTENEKYVFNNGMLVKFPINTIENLLFDKLLNNLKESHPSGLFSVWGIGAGEKSANANNWNKLNSGDLVIFYSDLGSIVVARVAQKFQSENVGMQIWPDNHNGDICQYIITVDEIFHSELTANKNFTKAFFNKISQLKAFEVFEFLALADVFSEAMLSSSSFLNFMASAEEVDTALVNNFLVDEIGDGSTIAAVVKGLGLSAAERKVIEKHAVSLAIEYFAMQGYSKIEDVGDYESFDLKVQRDSETLYVEVKGTTLNGDSIVLTRNEVDLHLKVFPNNALFLVTQITLHKGYALEASGGVIQVISPWRIVQESLSVIAFNYRM